jgi:hypothetical protein
METFTADEIAEIVHELGLPAQVETDENQFVTIAIDDDDFGWKIYLGDDGPFFRSIVLTAHHTVLEDPLPFANKWNISHVAPVVVFDDPATESPQLDDDGNFMVVMFWRIFFWNSVSKEYISHTIASFHEDVCELLGLEMVDV